MSTMLDSGPVHKLIVYIGFKAFDPLHIVHAGAPAGLHS